MNGTHSGASPASSKHAQNLEEFRLRISQDESIASQLRAGGEPGMAGASGVDDQTLLRFLKAEKYVSLRILLLPLKPVYHYHTSREGCRIVFHTVHFLRYDVSKAEQRLRAHAAWRKEYVPGGRIQEV